MIKAVYQTAIVICGGWNLHKTCPQVVDTVTVLHTHVVMRLKPDLHIMSSNSCILFARIMKHIVPPHMQATESV